MVDAAVEEVIRKLVTNPKFEQAIRQKIGSRIVQKNWKPNWNSFVRNFIS